MAATATATAPADAPAAGDGMVRHGITRAVRSTLQVQSDALATRVRLPLRTATGGQSGQWLGTGIGASLEFQDHRPYHPGDDPRHLNWAAYARTGHYTMKMYREEISPRLDVVLDASPSMFLTAEKGRRTLELLAFVQSCAMRAGALLRAYQANPDDIFEIPIESLRAHDWALAPEAGRLAAPALVRIPWRPQSLRVVITDLLYAAPPEGVLGPLLHTPGRTLIFSPWSRAEAQPDWEGQVELHDCESGEKRLYQISPSRLEKYQTNYRRHFALWDEACRGRGVALARVGDEGPLLDRFLESALPAGAIELCH